MIRRLLFLVVICCPVFADIYPKLPMKEGAIRLVDQDVLEKGFTGSWQQKIAKKNLLDAQENHEFPLVQYAVILSALLLLWYAYKKRASLIEYVYPLKKREQRRALKKVYSWKEKPPKNAVQYSARYSAMMTLLKEKFEVPLYANYQELKREKGFEAFVNRAEMSVFAQQVPDVKEYEKDLSRIESLFHS